MKPESMTDEELIRCTLLDEAATEREVVFAERLGRAIDALDDEEDT